MPTLGTAAAGADCLRDQAIGLDLACNFRAHRAVRFRARARLGRIHVTNHPESPILPAFTERL